MRNPPVLLPQVLFTAAGLNWNNPKVHEAFKEIISFWLKRGVGGFRFDAINTLFEDSSLDDEGIVKDKDGSPRINAYGDPVLDDTKTSNLPVCTWLCRRCALI